MTDIAVELMELNAEKSSLLRLPEETRRLIWQEVIGHMVHMECQRPIHFENTVKEWLHYHGPVPKQGLICHTCFARTSDDGYYCEFQKYDHNPFQASGAPRYDMFVGDNGHNHQACYEFINRYTRRVKDRSPTVSLSLLRMCRQIYVEGA